MKAISIKARQAFFGMENINPARDESKEEE